MSINSPIIFNRPTSQPEGWPNRLLIWLPLTAGLVVLYLPSLIDLFRGIWGTDQQAHGPIVLGIACWLMYRKWPEMWRVSNDHSALPGVGWPIFVFGLLLYVIGRSQDILIFEIGSVIWLLAAFILLIRGSAALKAQWFPLFFMLFMIPLPGAVVDALTMPMKMAVSYVAENILFWAGYPIARTGVLPTTAYPHRLRFGEQPCGRRVFDNGDDDLIPLRWRDGDGDQGDQGDLLSLDPSTTETRRLLEIELRMPREFLRKVELLRNLTDRPKCFRAFERHPTTEDAPLTRHTTRGSAPRLSPRCASLLRH